jgi:hypothetical protein
MMQSSASPIFKKSYGLGKVWNRIAGAKNIISIDNVSNINSLNDRYESVVTAYKEKRKELFGKFIKRYLKKEQSDHKKIFDSLNESLENFRTELDDYFNNLETHCEAIFSMIIEKLKLDTKDTDKTQSIVAIMISEYKTEIGVTLKIPKNTLTQGISLPTHWTVEEDDNVQEGKCSLQLKFGQVIGEFDASANALLALLSERSTQS